MSGSISMVGLWDAEKTVALTAHIRHKHVPSRVSPYFAAPSAVSRISFGPTALAAAVARTATTREAPIILLDALQRSALAQLETLIDNGITFKLSSHFQYLADTERMLFAARVGAGMTDLYMNALGYTWRANAACLSSSLDPHADFIYDGGNANGHGVVLAEAHGSFAVSASAQSVKLQSKRKYTRQVKPYISVISPFGQVIHGYSIAFGSAPGAPGAFLSLSETKVGRPRKPSAPPAPPKGQVARNGATPTPIALAAHRSNFLLIGADEVVDWIDWIRAVDGPPPEPVPVEFVRIQYAGRRFIAPVSSFWGVAPPWRWRGDYFDHPRSWRFLQWRRPPRTQVGSPHLGWFAMEEAAGTDFLKAVTRIIQNGGRAVPALLQLPTFEPVGFGLAGDGAALSGDFTGYSYALFRDGLALLGDPMRGRIHGVTRWSPKEGLFPQ